MDDVKVAIPYEMAETIRDYCGMQETCTFCIFDSTCKCWHTGNPCDWDLDMMRVEGKGNGN